MTPSLGGTPLLLGRLTRLPDGSGCSLMGHLGDVRMVPDAWYEVLRRMDGFHSLAELEAEVGLPAAEIETLFHRLRGEKRLGLLEEWNRTFHCRSCELYLTGARACPACGGATAQVPLLPPCDPWILQSDERAYVVQSLRDHAGVDADGDRLLLGNNGVRNSKFFWQVIYQGREVLRVDFLGVRPGEWKVSPGAGLAEVDWTRPSPGADQHLPRLAKANRAALDALEADAVAFLHSVAALHPVPLLLYFSGGKESVVMLRLLEKARQRANLVFVGTGVDFPEDARFVLDELKPEIDRNPLFRMEVNVAPPEKFLGVLRREGGLDARSPWCRKEIKAPLKAEVTRRLYGEAHFVGLEGSRWYENDFRRSHPRINFAQGYENQVWAHPIADWTGLDVWTYIQREGLKVNPMYARGYQRTTCWLCPIVNPFHVETSRRQYPELWRQVEGIPLKGFDEADNLNTPF